MGNLYHHNLTVLGPTTLTDAASGMTGGTIDCTRFTGWMQTQISISAASTGAAVTVALEGSMNKSFTNPVTLDASVAVVTGNNASIKTYSYMRSTPDALFPYMRFTATKSGTGTTADVQVDVFYQHLE